MRFLQLVELLLLLLSGLLVAAKEINYEKNVSDLVVTITEIVFALRVLVVRSISGLV